MLYAKSAFEGCLNLGKTLNFPNLTNIVGDVSRMFYNSGACGQESGYNNVTINFPVLVGFPSTNFYMVDMFGCDLSSTFARQWLWITCNLMTLDAFKLLGLEFTNIMQHCLSDVNMTWNIKTAYESYAKYETISSNINSVAGVQVSLQEIMEDFPM